MLSVEEDGTSMQVVKLLGELVTVGLKIQSAEVGIDDVGQPIRRGMDALGLISPIEPS